VIRLGAGAARFAIGRDGALAAGAIAAGAIAAGAIAVRVTASGAGAAKVITAEGKAAGVIAAGAGGAGAGIKVGKAGAAGPLTSNDAVWAAVVLVGSTLKSASAATVTTWDTEYFLGRTSSGARCTSVGGWSDLCTPKSTTPSSPRLNLTGPFVAGSDALVDEADEPVGRAVSDRNCIGSTAIETVDVGNLPSESEGILEGSEDSTEFVPNRT
jgi:hypothetical protein